MITNLARITMFITYIIFNIIILTLFRKNFEFIKYICTFNIIILVIMFFHDLNDFIIQKNHSDREKKFNNKLIDNSYTFYNFIRYFHLFLTFDAFFYLFMFCYIIYLVYTQEISSRISFHIILFGIVGLFIVFKELILQFSRCLYASYNKKLGTLIQNEKKGKCHIDYHNYWECVNS